MKKMIQYTCTLIILLSLLPGCKKFEAELSTIMTDEQVYSSKDGVTSAVSSLYDHLHDDQAFNTDVMNDWDESIRNGNYSSVDYGDGYRRLYNFDFIRQVNTHLENMEKYSKGKLEPAAYRYLYAEARFIRAYTYFMMVKNMGGIPVITEKIEYDQNADFSTYRIAREKEDAVYEFIRQELDDIKEDLDIRANNIPVKNRASKGAALALKCRAMLYAGSIAKYNTTRSDLALSLPNGETGIAPVRANYFYEQAVEAAKEIEQMNVYSLYKGPNWATDKAGSFSELFLKKNTNNPEAIFVKDFDGTNKKNTFTEQTIPRSMRSIGGGSNVGPTLNLVESFELTDGTSAPLKTVYGTETVEDVNAETSSLNYIIYNNAEDIFAGRDPRLFGSIITPGSKFRGADLQLWAGRAVWRSDINGYRFEHVVNIDDIKDNNAMTGLDGPHASSADVTNTGFLLRKYVDTKSGSEMAGQSDVAFIRFRYAEVLLNAAEAAYEMGDPDGLALGYLNKVRERAGVNLLSFITSIGDIRRERLVELAFEDHRFNDVRRWRIGDQVFNGQTTTASAVILGLWPYKIFRPGHASDGKWIFRRVKANKRINPVSFRNWNYYSSFSDEALSRNPLLVKNPYQN